MFLNSICIFQISLLKMSLHAFVTFNFSLSAHFVLNRKADCVKLLSLQMLFVFGVFNKVAVYLFLFYFMFFVFGWGAAYGSLCYLLLSFIFLQKCSDGQNIPFLNNSLHSHVELIPFWGTIVNVTQWSLSLDKADASNKAWSGVLQKSPLCRCVARQLWMAETERS